MLREPNELSFSMLHEPNELSFSMLREPNELSCGELLIGPQVFMNADSTKLARVCSKF